MANVAPVLTVHGTVRTVREFDVRSRTVQGGKDRAAELTILTDAGVENGGFLSVYVGADTYRSVTLPVANDQVEVVVRLGEPRMNPQDGSARNVVSFVSCTVKYLHAAKAS